MVSINPIHFVLILLFLFLSVNVNAQIEITGKNKKLSKNEIAHLVATEQIRNLKQGYLLVRLQTKSKSIELIRSKGYEDKADEITREQKDKNKLIAMAFGTNIDFCKTLFFYSDDSDKILAKEFDQVDFMNSNLDVVPNNLDTSTFFLVLDLNLLKERDQNFDTYRQEATEKGIENVPVKYSSTNLNLPAFVVLDQNFDQLTDPFPYYVRAYNLDPRPERILKAALKLNKRLNRFYLRNN